MLLGTPLWLWLSFGALVVALLAFDLGVLHRRERAIGVKQSLWLSAGYMAVALLFAAWVGLSLGAESGMAFLTGYVIEKTLALDNLFLIASVFTALAIPRQYQHKVLFWGILGAIVLRAVLIGLGAALVSQFHWILYFFGAFLLLTGVRMLVRHGAETSRTAAALLGWLRRHLRMTPDLQGDRFWVRAPSNGPGEPVREVLWATPLLLALVMIELLDLMFAVDSVPAVFAVTQDPFIVYSSNLFALLGLRALYFCLAALVERFRYLHYALAAVLVFVGGKMLAADLLGELPAWASLLVTVGLLSSGIVYSSYRARLGAAAGRAASV